LFGIGLSAKNRKTEESSGHFLQPNSSGDTAAFQFIGLFAEGRNTNRASTQHENLRGLADKRPGNHWVPTWKLMMPEAFLPIDLNYIAHNDREATPVNGRKSQAVEQVAAVGAVPGEFTLGGVGACCPGVSRDMEDEPANPYS
jgi:hypothetical protein